MIRHNLSQTSIISKPDQKRSVSVIKKENKNSDLQKTRIIPIKSMKDIS